MAVDSQYRIVASERQRRLKQQTFSPSSLITEDLPRDTVLKFLLIRLSGSISTTFGSGTPVADYAATFDNLIPRIDVVVNGSRTVKSVKPHLMHMQQLLWSVVQGERQSSAGASAATDNYPLADAGFTYGTTTQLTTVRETVVIAFENIHWRVQRESTWLNLKGAASAEVRLTTNAYSSLLGFGNTAPVTFASSTFAIDFYTIEAQDIPGNVRFKDWRQTTKQVTFSSQVTAYPIDINRGNLLQGIMLFTLNGAAGSTTTATGKIPSNLVLTNLSLVVNGQLNIKSTDFKALVAENRARFGIYAPYSSSSSRFEGTAYLDLTSDDSRGEPNSLLDVSPPNVDNVQLYVDSNTPSNTDYTNPITVFLMTDEIVSFE